MYDEEDFTLTWKQAQSVYALIHDWIWMFQGNELMTVEHGQRLRTLYDLIEYRQWELEEQGVG